jgi:hypothetical protein
MIPKSVQRLSEKIMLQKVDQLVVRVIVSDRRGRM